MAEMTKLIQKKVTKKTLEATVTQERRLRD